MNAASVAPPLDSPPKDWTKVLEVFARDLLVLVKTFSVYPAQHPAPRQVAERLAHWSPNGVQKEISLGITPSKFLVDNQFIGEAGSRIETLAHFLHGRKVMRLGWGGHVGADDVLAFAATLSETRETGEQLRQQLLAAGVVQIAVEPVDLAKIHGTLSLRKGDATSTETASKELDAWLWLHDDAVGPEDLGRVFQSEAFWALSQDDPAFPARLLFNHGRKLDHALTLLAPGEREAVRNQLQGLGERLPATDLAAIVMAEVQRGNGSGEALANLLGRLAPEDLVEIMAGVVALSEGATPRVLAAFRNLAPGTDAAQMLPLVEARLHNDPGQAYAVEIWRNLKTFLLDLEEGDFFGDDYLLELEELPERQVEALGACATEFLEDAEPHLDWIHLGLAATAGGEVRSGVGADFGERFRARLQSLPLGDLLELVTATGQEVPALFREEPELAREAFAKIIAGARRLDGVERQAAIDFAKAHEEVLLDLLLGSLIREPRIAVRKFLVSVLSALSPRTTEAMVAQALNAPWYYTRNVATVLGRRRESASAQVLEALLEHPHDKVRKESLKGLGQMTGAARSAVRQFAEDPFRHADERALAQRILRRYEVET